MVQGVSRLAPRESKVKATRESRRTELFMNEIQRTRTHGSHVALLYIYLERQEIEG